MHHKQHRHGKGFHIVVRCFLICGNCRVIPKFTLFKLQNNFTENHMKKLGFLLFLLASLLLKYTGQDEKMNLFINDLMNKMTVEEKIGQLNLTTAGGFVTGSAVKQ